MLSIAGGDRPDLPGHLNPNRLSLIMIMPVSRPPADDAVPNTTEAAMRSLKVQIVQNPAVCLALAVAAGALLGWLVKRN